MGIKREKREKSHRKEEDSVIDTLREINEELSKSRDVFKTVAEGHAKNSNMEADILLLQVPPANSPNMRELSVG